MRIGIVNDMTLAVQALQQVLATVPEHKVAWIAFDGAEAVEKCKQDRPDLILMDLIMPVMDGVEATRLIMQQCPCAILVVTATVDGNISKVFEAMGCGALDAVNTPVLGQAGGAADLLEKIAIIGKLTGRPHARGAVEPCKPCTEDTSHDQPLVVAIGASTGGPKALNEIISNLPADLNAAVVVIQHVDKTFAAGLVKWLQEKSTLPISIAEDNSTLHPGSIVIAGTNDHLVMVSGQRLGYRAEPVDLSYRPSVNVFFESLVLCRYKPGVAVVLTGMGRDGSDGLLTLRNAGWHTIAQDEGTSVVYGMPRAAAELQAAKEILPITKIAPAIVAASKNLRCHEM